MTNERGGRDIKLRKYELHLNKVEFIAGGTEVDATVKNLETQDLCGCVCICTCEGQCICGKDNKIRCINAGDLSNQNCNIETGITGGINSSS